MNNARRSSSASPPHTPCGSRAASACRRHSTRTLLVFASLFVVTKDSDRRSLAGFSTWTVIGFCGAMMLVIAVQHSSLRSATGSTGVVYAEYFYFILYLVIALVAFNVVEYTSTHRLKLLDWNGNMAAHLIYWPIVTVLLFAAILAVFVV